MIKLVVKGKLVEMSGEELKQRFSPNSLASLDQLKVIKALAEGPKQVPAILKDMGLGESKDPDQDYGRFRYLLIKLREKGVVDTYKVNAKTALWYLTERGSEALEKGAV